MTSFRLSLTLLCSTRYSERSRKRTVSVVSIVVVIRCFGYSHSRGVYIFIFVLFTFFFLLHIRAFQMKIGCAPKYLPFTFYFLILEYSVLDFLLSCCFAIHSRVSIAWCCYNIIVFCVVLLSFFLFFLMWYFLSLFILIIGLFSLELIHSRQEIKSVKMWLHGIQTVRASFTKRLNHKSVCGVTHTHTWAWTLKQTLSLQCGYANYWARASLL